MNDPDMLDLRSVFGVQARITQSASTTGGSFVAMECTADPGSGTMIHFHPEQDERFEVLEGRLEVLRDGQWTAVLEGESCTVPRGAIHAWRNAGGLPARFLNVHQPALGFEAHLRTLDRLAREGKIRGKGNVRSLMYMSMSAAKHRPDVTVRPPQWVVNATASLGRLLGFDLGAEDVHTNT